MLAGKQAGEYSQRQKEEWVLQRHKSLRLHLYLIWQECDQEACQVRLTEIEFVLFTWQQG